MKDLMSRPPVVYTGYLHRKLQQFSIFMQPTLESLYMGSKILTCKVLCSFTG